MTTIDNIAIADTLRGIADDIEKFGHYQEVAWAHNSDEIWNVITKTGKCCVVANPTCFYSGEGTRDTIVRFIRDKIRFTSDRSITGPVSWSNETPTHEVVSSLRKWANSL